ncbi:deacetylase, histone deacetylase/acetoin utilization protein [Leptothrix ochracea L12]|uniref:Deacetylase, histone deacetylase/acetoin utilization protein n=1 Tax=Leptothrix ochracea L12 TaxID=735332 RepID=I4Z617_9BURK|nr:histone deacetylase family protein [Leptothrix ochracea]EIM31659.1 deacetylase, histone deacetylase/acetoin utilization protein [Leptothrix ochracea L12]
MSTFYYAHPDCLGHDMGAGHPECPQRLGAIEDHLLATGLDIALLRADGPLADHKDLTLAHSEGYLLELDEVLQQVTASGEPRHIDPDTVVGPGTRQAMLRSAGLAVAATDAVIDGQAENAFCATRPPGHHATRGESMGFCFLNNVAIAARHAVNVRGLERVAIIDFDVHHGNGTEDIVAGDDRILMVSFFQDQIYPFSGGIPMGDNMLNLAIPAYTRGPVLRELIEANWLPRLHDFAPQMIFISAGFDAHREDELGQLGLVEADYAWITRKIMDVAQRHAQGRIVSCLEGGYNLSSLARSVAAHLRVLADV